eukprot:TRINITY_DN75911_c0_g1_i1.p1 TRINITY_DN75911_c0_g1~~TRINITY_DN75911_c0_g1_i1.p1  ORF type:complete len:342 (-),score=67.70 TRINITY_DN75911_c0_g1_i1:67-1092(-)
MSKSNDSHAEESVDSLRRSTSTSGSSRSSSPVFKLGVQSKLSSASTGSHTESQASTPRALLLSDQILVPSQREYSEDSAESQVPQTRRSKAKPPLMQPPSMPPTASTCRETPSTPISRSSSLGNLLPNSSLVQRAFAETPDRSSSMLSHASSLLASSLVCSGEAASHGIGRASQPNEQNTHASSSSGGILQMLGSLLSLNQDDCRDPDDKALGDRELVASLEARLMVAQSVQKATEETLKAERKAFEEERKAWRKERTRLQGSLDAALEVLASRLPPTALPHVASKLAAKSMFVQALSSVSEQDVADSSAELSISSDSDPSKHWTSDESAEGLAKEHRRQI